MRYEHQFRANMEAAIGFEPMDEGFADLCLSHLATPPRASFSTEFRVGSWELGVKKDAELGVTRCEGLTPNSELETVNC